MLEVKIKNTNAKIDVYAYTEKKLREFTKGAADSITDNLINSRVVTNEVGGSYADPSPLSQKYKAYKQKNYGYSNIFWGRTKKLLKSVKFKKVGKLHYRIYIASDRGEVAEYINNGTDKMPARKFFGISDETIKNFQDEFGKERLNG